MTRKNKPYVRHAVRGAQHGYYIFRAWRRNRDTGEIEWPQDGKKAFKIWVSIDKPGKKPSGQ